MCSFLFLSSISEALFTDKINTLTKEDIPLCFYKNLDLYNNKKINKSEFARLMNWSCPKLDRILKLNSKE